MNYLKRYWKFPILSFGLLILCLFTIPLIRSYYNFHINLITSLVGFFIFSYFIFRNAKSKIEINVRLLLTTTPFIVIIILSFFYSLIDYLPGLVFAPTIGIILGYFLSTFKNIYARVFIILTPIFIGIWVFTSFSKIWQDFMIYRTFTSGETFRDSPMFTFYKDNHSVNNDYFKGKTSVFFIWNTSCPYTPRYIPSLKNKLSKFSNNSKIKFYSVNIPMGNDAINADSAYLSNYNMNIELLKGPAIEEMYKTFGQAPIPLTIILNPEGKIIYWGNVDKIDNTLQEL